jgi:hypothetical protein
VRAIATLIGSTVLLAACGVADVALDELERDPRMAEANRIVELGMACGMKHVSVSFDVFTSQQKLHFDPSEERIDEKIECLNSRVQAPQLAKQPSGNRFQ